MSPCETPAPLVANRAFNFHSGSHRCYNAPMVMTGYFCERCAASRSGPAAMYRCPVCDGNLDVAIDLDRVNRDALRTSRDPSMWRYASLLPVSVPRDDTGPLRSVGGTPLYDAARAASLLGVRRLWIKDEGRNPTGSLKDRASAVVVQRAIDIDAPTIITASTGNAGVALAAMARCAGKEAVILVPASAPPAKIAQLKIFGARLVLVRGTYDDAFALSEKAARELGWYCRNTGSNPFTVEGKKTVSFEIAEQLGFRAPDRIVVPVGDGNILVGVYKGWAELQKLGLVDRIPKILAVQAEGSSPIAKAFMKGATSVEPCSTSTLADSIAAGAPADGERALRAVRATSGSFVIVSDDAILEAIAALGQHAAVFAEPAAAASWAGLVRALDAGAVDRDEEIVLLVTGSGLKDIAAAGRAARREAPVIDPSIAALRIALNEKGTT